MTKPLGWLEDIGADPNDDVDTRKSKALLVYVAILILPISLVWGVLYLALGAPSGVVATYECRFAMTFVFGDGRSDRHSVSSKHEELSP